jgi:Domain of unknown function (DUF4410)
MRRLTALLFTLLLIAPALFAGKATTAPGKYKEWGPDIDEIEILRTLPIADYDRIVIPKFDTSKVQLPSEKERWYETMKIVLAGYTDAFAEAFKKELKAKATVHQGDEGAKKPKTLIIRGTVGQLDPGTRAGRYFGGFGAGAASTRLTVEIVDAATDEVLVRVTQARRSAGTWKPGGGSDLEVMRDAIHAVGKDIAHVLDSF